MSHRLTFNPAQTGGHKIQGNRNTRSNVNPASTRTSGAAQVLHFTGDWTFMADTHFSPRRTAEGQQR